MNDKPYIRISNELKSIIDDFDIALKKRGEFELGFNLFSLISNVYQKENLHTEIIYALLNTQEKHNEHDAFLNCFLSFLKDQLLIDIDSSNYHNIVVTKEVATDVGRIDILIHSDSHAVIIENKVNNAKDMDNQLVRYYNHCINKSL